MEQRAVVDRIEDGNLAVLLVGDAETEIVVPLADLPNGAAAGSVLVVEIEDAGLISARLDDAAAAEASRRVEDKLRRLRERGRRL